MIASGFKWGAIGLCSLAFASAPAWGFPGLKIVEVFPGTAKNPKAQYILLEAPEAGMNQVKGSTVTIFDTFGSAASKLTFKTDVSAAAAHSTIWIATPQAESLFKISADLKMEPTLVVAGGKVCYENLDCASWGRFASSDRLPSRSGVPFNRARGLVLGHPMQRDVSRENATVLDEGDDTNESQADFKCAAAANPKNNAGKTGTYTDPAPCPN